MKITTIAIEDAVGLHLAHDLTQVDAGKGIKGARFRRGHVVTEEDLPVLRRMGKLNLTVLDLEEGDDAHRKTIDLGAWWAELFEPPCVLLSGRSMASVEACARTGADFVAVRAAVWEHPDGPATAIAEANAILDRVALELPDTD